jgi:hypothetical protein
MEIFGRLGPITDADRETYAREETAAYNSMLADDEWDLDDFDDIKLEDEPTPLDGLIVDTRDWMHARPEDIEELNLPFAAFSIRLSNAEQLSANCHIGKRNFTRGILCQF